MKARFTLRTLFGVTTLCAILFGGLAWELHHDARQRRAIEKLRTCGAFVGLQDRTRWCAIFQCMFGPMTGVTVDEVNFVFVSSDPWKKNASKPCLLALHDLVSVRSLNIHNADIGDDEVAAIVAIDSLTELGLSGNRITDKGISTILTLQRLEVLDVTETAIGRAALEMCSEHRSLKVLSITSAENVEWFRTIRPDIQLIVTKPTRATIEGNE